MLYSIIDKIFQVLFAVATIALVVAGLVATAVLLAIGAVAEKAVGVVGSNLMFR